MRIVLILAFLSAGGMRLMAQWDDNPITMDNPVSTTALHEKNIFTVADGAGGAILAWEAYDTQNGDNYILMQRKTASGAVAWGTINNPLLVFSRPANGFLEISDILADGSGGAWIAWINGIDDTLSDIYLQRFSSSGTAYFASPGIRLNASNGHYYLGARLCATANGVIAAWTDMIQPADSLLPTYAQVFAQRYSNAGVPQWAAGGLQVCAAPERRALANLVSDGSDGALLAFSDARNSGIDPNNDFNNVDIYAQRIGPAGSRLWSDTGKPVTRHPFNQYTLEAWESACSIVSDGVGGMLIVFRDRHNGNESEEYYYVQRMDAAGNALWAAGGIPLSNEAADARENLVVVQDGLQGMVASWKKRDFQNRYGIMAQRITATGIPLWGAAGLEFGNQSTLYGGQSAGLAADGSGHFVIAWTEVDTTSFTNVVRAQRFNAAGAVQWPADGIKICTNPVAWPSGVVLVHTAADRLMPAWMDYRNTSVSEANIYAALLRTDGTLVGTTAAVYFTTANGNWSNPATWQGGQVPPPGASVVIRHQVTGNVNASCTSLQLEPGANLFLLTGVHIIVVP